MAITYDVSAFQATETGNYSQIFIEGTNSGTLVFGPRKLAQRFIIELMTERGSLKYLPNRGTAFIAAAKTGQILTEVDIFSSFAIALLTIKDNLKAEEADEDPDDERLDDAEIEEVILTPGVVSLKIRVHTLAGTSVGINIPLEFNLAPQAGIQ